MDKEVEGEVKLEVDTEVEVGVNLYGKEVKEEVEMYAKEVFLTQAPSFY